MYNHLSSSLEDIDEMDLRITPLQNNIIVQFSSTMARGTVIIGNSVSENDMSELWKIIFNSIEELILLGSGSDIPQ